MRNAYFALIIIIITIASDSIAAHFTENFISYYASIKSSEVNVRKGPNSRYPIEWVYVKKGEPVEVIAQFEHWFKIKDYNGDEGWVRSVMITKKRTGIVIGKQKNEELKSYVNLYNEPDPSSRIIANIESSKRVAISKCKKQYCEIKIANLSGWIEKKDLWGVYRNEEFK